LLINIESTIQRLLVTDCPSFVRELKSESPEASADECYRGSSFFRFGDAPGLSCVSN